MRLELSRACKHAQQSASSLVYLAKGCCMSSLHIIIVMDVFDSNECLMHARLWTLVHGLELL